MSRLRTNRGLEASVKNDRGLVVGNWILHTGKWRDEGIWRDGKNWKDN